MNLLSFTINSLLLNFTGHRGIFNFSKQTFDSQIKYINIEQGFYALYAKIKASEIHRIKHLPINKNNRDWSMLLLSGTSLYIDNILYQSGLFVGFNDRTYTLSVEPNQEICLFVIFIHKSYIQQYQYLECFKKLRESKRSIYHIPTNKLSYHSTFTPEKTMGLVKTKAFAIILLTALRVKVEKIDKKLIEQIDFYCSECLEKKQDILPFLSQKLRFDADYTMALFKDIFKQEPHYYYTKFKEINAKKYIQSQKNQLDDFILQCMQASLPVAIFLGIKFDISAGKYRRLFFEVMGVSLNRYCESVKLNLARKLLANGHKTTKVANTIGLSTPITLTHFFKNEKEFPLDNIG